MQKPCQTKLLGTTAPSRVFKGKAYTNEHSLKQINMNTAQSVSKYFAEKDAKKRFQRFL